MKNIFYIIPIAVGITLSACKPGGKTADKDSEKKQDSIVAKRPIHCKSKTSDKDWYTSGKKAPMFKGLKGIDFKITTTSQEAQDYFNQGMMLSYGFNHAEAARSFYEAGRIDPQSAMCFWGYAYVLGPNYNGGMEEDNYERAYTAAQKALSLSGNCTEMEKDLILALTQRYSKQPPTDRAPLDIAYSAAMKKVYEKHPKHPDVGALYAESIMDLHPWDLFEKKTKKPKAWTPEILAILEKLMKANPVHPGAHHFYIHAVEASATPEKGLASAKLLQTLVPGSGHLVHMPSHIYINTGDYHLASLSNIDAVEVDIDYITYCHAHGAYPLAYYPHNYHFLSATATLEGDSRQAWKAAIRVRDNTAKDIMEDPGWGTLQHYYTIPYYVAVKFAMWDSILAIPMPGKTLVYPRAVLHYARGMAYLGKKNIPAAEKELSQLLTLSKDTILKTITIWNINSSNDLLNIASTVLSGEINRQKKDYFKAIVLLTNAVTLEDKLNYDEPPDWFFSIRHHLGAAMIEAGMFAEAEKVYFEDLKTWKENGWALWGLYHSLEKQGKKKEAAAAKARFDKAWKYADVGMERLHPF